MANKLDNLKKGKATQFKTGEEQAKIASEGGKQSGTTRRAKADLREDAQTVLDGTYKVTDKKTKEISEHRGSEMIILTLFKIATDPNNKNCIAAIKLLSELTGANRTPESVMIDKATAALIQAKADMLKGGDTATLDRLDSILTEMRKKADDN